MYGQIYRYMTYENALCLRLALATGLRVGDCLKIRCEDIRGRTIYYTAEKTGKDGRKVIDKALADELRRNGGGKGYVFKHRLSGDKHRTRQTVWRNVKAACKAAGVPEHITPHSARKTYAVQIRDKYGLQRAQEELQHERSEVTMLYAFADLLGRSEQPIESTDDKLYYLMYSACKQALTDFYRELGIDFFRNVNSDQ